jgi:hypothetical protein
MLGWILGFLWLAVLKAWLGSHVALDADALGVADLWNSLHSGGHLGDWIMGPHPYVFPDLAIYGVGAYFAPDIVGRQICFGLIQGFLLWWFLARLMKRMVRLDGSAARAYAAAGLLVLLPCLNAANGLGGALVPGYHGGALLCALAFLSWCVGQDRALSSWPAVLWAACLVGLVWASDQITPIWVDLPGLLLSLGLSGKARRRIWGAAALSWIARGLALYCWERMGMQVAHFRWSYFFGHAGAMLASLWAQCPAAVDSALVPILLGLLALVLLCGRGKKMVPLGGWLAMALVLMALFGLGLAALEGSVQGRYFIGFVCLSVPFLPLACSLRLDGHALPLAAAGLVGLLSLAYLQSPAEASPKQALIQAQWLDSQTGALGLTQGLADYPHARPLRLLSQEGLFLSPVATDGGALKPYAWIVDRRIFTHGRTVQFVVLNGLDPAAVRVALGPPFKELDSAGLSVWIYSKPVPKRIRI